MPRIPASTRSAAPTISAPSRARRSSSSRSPWASTSPNSWAAIWRKQAAALGYTFEIRDPNWSTDAGTKALTAAIAEKPDLLIIHNPDIQSYARLLKRAQDDGIKVLQVNMPSVTTTDSYIGADWVALGEEEAKALVDHCGTGKGPSTKIAFVQGVVTGAANIYLKRGITNVLSQHPEIKIVSDQAANYDPAKARAIMETVLQQDPDLCGAVRLGQRRRGIGAAVDAAGKTGQVFVVTSGAGNKSACDNVEKGLLSMDISYNSPLQGDIAVSRSPNSCRSKGKAGSAQGLLLRAARRRSLRNRSSRAIAGRWTI